MRTLAAVLAAALIFASSPAQARVFAAPFRLSLDAGYSFLNYSEDHPFQPSQSVSDFQQHSVMVRVELLYYLISHLNADTSRYEGDLAFLGDISYTGLPISSNLAGTSARVLRANLRLGTVVPILPAPFTLNLMGGFYQTNMWVTDDAFGYTKLTGPQIYPVIHWARYSEKQTLLVISAFFKYSPITDGTTDLSSSNREISTGLAVRIPSTDKFEFLKQGYEPSFTFKFDYADLKHTFPAIRNIQVSSHNYSLTVGYDW